MISQFMTNKKLNRFAVAQHAKGTRMTIISSIESFFPNKIMRNYSARRRKVYKVKTSCSIVSFAFRVWKCERRQLKCSVAAFFLLCCTQRFLQWFWCLDTKYQYYCLPFICIVNVNELKRRRWNLLNSRIIFAVVVNSNSYWFIGVVFCDFEKINITRIQQYATSFFLLLLLFWASSEYWIPRMDLKVRVGYGADVFKTKFLVYF